MFSIDASKVEDVGGGQYTLLQPGDYLATCIKADWVENKNKTGYLLHVVFRTAEGVEVDNRFNMVHQNEKAAQIGQAQWKQCVLAMAQGLDQPAVKKLTQIKNADFSAMLSKKVVLEIVNEEFVSNKLDEHGRQKTLMSNKIKAYKPVLEGKLATPAKEAPPAVSSEEDDVPDW